MAKLKFYDIHAECVDTNGEKHVVTVVGKFEQKYVRKEYTQKVPVDIGDNRTVQGKLAFNRRVLLRTLTVGVSICHPNDKFDVEKGIEVAKSRIERGDDSGQVRTNDVTMLTEDLIMAELLGKLSYICSNIDKYIGNEED